MSEQLHVKSMVIHDCGRVEVEVDHQNGYVQILGYSTVNGSRARWPSFTLTLFSPDDAPPELAPVTYIDPPRDEDEHEDEKNFEYADKHGA